MIKLWNRKTVSVNSRKNRRSRSFCLLKYCVLNKSPQKTAVVNSRDISASGAGFVSDEKLPLNAILEIDIYLPPLKDFITVMANVVRELKIRDSNQYFIGTQFTAVDPREKSKINSYIESLAKDPATRIYLDKKAGYFKRSLL